MRKFLALIALTLAAGVAHADNGLIYLGAGIANDNLKDSAATNSSLNSTHWKAWAGVRPSGLFAVEADYIDLGTQSVTSNFVSGGSSTNVKYKAFTGYAVGFVPIPVPFLDIFGKVGLARWSASGGTFVNNPPAPSQFFSLSDKGTQFAWGAGGQVHIGNVGARLEYESFSVRNTDGVNLVSLSVFLNLF